MNPPRLVLVALLVTTLGVGVATLVGLARGPAPGPAAVLGADVTPRPEVDAALALGSWDRDRSRAWAAGRPEQLAALYLPGASAGRADVAMLRRWDARGWRVRGLRTQVLALRVLRRDDRSLVVRVTDRLAAGTAVRGPSLITLPADRPSTRVVSLRWYDGRWRVASVTPAGG